MQSDLNLTCSESMIFSRKKYVPEIVLEHLGVMIRFTAHPSQVLGTRTLPTLCEAPSLIPCDHMFRSPDDIISLSTNLAFKRHLNFLSAYVVSILIFVSLLFLHVVFLSC